jgi:hypothetical protein
MKARRREDRYCPCANRYILSERCLVPIALDIELRDAEPNFLVLPGPAPSPRPLREGRTTVGMTASNCRSFRSRALRCLAV